MASSSTPLPTQEAFIANLKAPATVPEDLCCSICLDEYESGEHQAVTMEPCGHVFGKCCIVEWFQNSENHANSTSCPMCRRQLFDGIIIEQVNVPHSAGYDYSNLAAVTVRQIRIELKSFPRQLATRIYRRRHYRQKAQALILENCIRFNQEFSIFEEFFNNIQEVWMDVAEMHLKNFREGDSAAWTMESEMIEIVDRQLHAVVDSLSA
ncbi:hypothetical protein K504DRAFT_466056 [Pleomassaria siparia CBS 279.74]|uniref:RING-type domain-containing protein n=1 Tax=Pleomassaria siparia CBS 279.74 TaxID=1314801 RepID=A0A6G1KE18_9PLEO|nr:hypothetical protein K504DRAFT_466056 [Pleomassaria siparia CBS 279.74]